MTDDMSSLRKLLQKNSDADLVREMIGFAAQRLMDPEVEGLTGAGHAERAWAHHPAQRLPRPGLGYTIGERRPSDFQAEEKVPIRGFLEPRPMAEKALSAVIQEPSVSAL